MIGREFSTSIGLLLLGAAATGHLPEEDDLGLPEHGGEGR
jgi:hypothetical protein